MSKHPGSRPHRRRCQFERFEPRTLLAANPIISEFMASNANSLYDAENGDPDWIELYNNTRADINLEGWHLTDDPQHRSLWTFPSVNLPAGGYLIVFASGRGSPDAAGNLHTNFSLDADGDYVALLRPDGVTVAHEIGTPAQPFPPQKSDISYGIPLLSSDFIGAGSPVDTLLPDPSADARYGRSWTGGDEQTFQDAGGLAGWQHLTNGLGRTPQDVMAKYRSLVTSEPSLLSYYTFDNDSPGKNGIHDVAGTANHPGQVVGSAAFGPGVDGQNGKSLLLDGKGYVSLGRVADFLLLDGAATIETWLRPTFTADSRDRGWFGTSTLRPQARDRYSLRVKGDHSGLQNTTSGGGQHDASLFLQPETWIHVVAVFDNEQTQFFVNGQRVEGLGLGTTSGIVDVCSTQIGTTGLALDGEHFVGNIDEVAVYNEPLDAATIRRHYEAIAFSKDGQFVTSDLDEITVDDSPSLYLRFPFGVADPNRLSTLTMTSRFSDGFVAYLNGTEIVRQNAPEELSYRSVATEAHDVTVTEVFDLSKRLGLLRTGQNVLAIHALAPSRQDNGFLFDTALTGYALVDGNPQFFLDPTPGGPNAAGVTGFAPTPVFDQPRGIYGQALQLTISAPTVGATLVYTTDGSPPSLTHGVHIPPSTEEATPSVTMEIANTSTIRAVAIATGLAPSDIETYTYILLRDLDDVSRLGPLNSSILRAHQDTIIQDLQAIPSISLVLQDELMFGPGGIYANERFRGRTWEVPTSVEYFDFQSGAQFQIDAGVRLSGGGASQFAKKPLRLVFRSDYGDQQLEFPLFEGSPVESFDTLVLRSSGHDSFLYTSHAVYVRDSFLRDTERAMGQPSARTSCVHLFVNGKYRGLYAPTERPDADFMANHLGGDLDDWDVIKGQSEVVNGTIDVWNEVQEIARGGLEGDEAYQQIQQAVDLDNLCDDMILRIYSGDEDWGAVQNLYIAGNPQEGGFKFFTWDAEFTLGNEFGGAHNVQLNKLTEGRLPVTRSIGTPGGLFWKLRDNPEFRLRFADRLQKHFFNDGALTPTKLVARWDAVINDVEEPLVMEAARWEGNLDAFRREADWIRNTWFPVRTQIVLEDFREVGLYPDIAAPEYQVDDRPQHGGEVLPGAALTIEHLQGISVYFTTDGSDPRQEGGGLNPAATKFVEPIVIGGDMVVKARAFDGQQWSALSEGRFRLPIVAADQAHLRVSEVHYNPADPTAAEEATGFTDNDEFEFIELVNISRQRIDLSGVQLKRICLGDSEQGVDFDFSSAKISTLAPGERIVVVENVDAFQARYGTQVSVAGQWTGHLSNGGEWISLMAGNAEIQRFAYDDRWYPETDGGGASLEIIDPGAADLNGWLLQANWRPSLVLGGTPGYSSAQLGDLDNDGRLDASDIDRLYSSIRDQNHPWEFDLTRDGLVDQADVDRLVEELLDSSFGDTTLDGIFDEGDLTLAFRAAEYEDGIDGNSSWADGDWDGDGDFTSCDFVLAFAKGGWRALP